MIVNIETYKEILGLSDVSHCRLQIPRFQGIFYFYFVLHVSGLSWGKSWNIGRDTKNSEAKQFNHVTINFHRLGNNVIVHPLHNIPTGDWLLVNISNCYEFKEITLVHIICYLLTPLTVMVWVWFLPGEVYSVCIVPHAWQDMSVKVGVLEEVHRLKDLSHGWTVVTHQPSNKPNH